MLAPPLHIFQKKEIVVLHVCLILNFHLRTYSHLSTVGIDMNILYEL